MVECPSERRIADNQVETFAPKAVLPIRVESGGVQIFLEEIRAPDFGPQRGNAAALDDRAGFFGEKRVYLHADNLDAGGAVWNRKLGQPVQNRRKKRAVPAGRLKNPRAVFDRQPGHDSPSERRRSHILPALSLGVALVFSQSHGTGTNFI